MPLATAGIYVMAILGCADDGQACRTVQTLDAVYTSRAECAAATGIEATRHGNLDFPVILADCRSMEGNPVGLRGRGAEPRRTHSRA